MGLPQTPPSKQELEQVARDLAKRDLAKYISAMQQATADADGKYRHWDTLRRIKPPDGLTQKEWWLGIKFARSKLWRPLPLVDKLNQNFVFALTDAALKMLHEIDSNARGTIRSTEPITNPDTRDRYLVNSLIEEAITSSQLEGASTTSQVARDMIRSGRPPVDVSERMILNNFLAINRIQQIARNRLTPDEVLRLHDIVVRGTLDSLDAAGRLRKPDEPIVVQDQRGRMLHDPPPAEQLPARLSALCDFANSRATDATFIHPIMKAIVLHFWLAYDHPFVDGNGRTARALFYWAMLSEGYWLCEYISISRILKQAPAKYGKSYLYVESDDNDLTYFILAQLRVICRAIDELQDYLFRKTAEVRDTENLIRSRTILNHRQIALLGHALRHPGQRYTIESHRNSHRVVYQTARKDLLDLADLGLLIRVKSGKKFVFKPQGDIADRIKNLP